MGGIRRLVLKGPEIDQSATAVNRYGDGRLFNEQV